MEIKKYRIKRTGVWIACLLMLSGCGGQGQSQPLASAKVQSTADEKNKMEPETTTSESNGQTQSQNHTQSSETTGAASDLTPDSDFGSPDEEPLNERCYELVTEIPAAEVEQFAKQVKQQLLGRDWSALSKNLIYPITIDGVTYHTAEEFSSADLEEKLNPYFFVELEEESCRNMSSNWSGIMMGKTGRVWISEVLNEDLSSQGLKITAINGLTESFGLPGGVGMKAAEDGVTFTSIRLLLENETGLNLIFGDDFKLRKYDYEKDTWETVEPLSGETAFNDIAYMPTRNHPVEWTADLSAMYGSLEEGRYMIVKTVRDGDAPKDSAVFECVYDFILSVPRGGDYYFGK